MLKDFDRGVKVIMAGSSGVGKSSLLLRFVDDMWSNSTLSTIGVDFKFKNFQVKGQKVKLQIWDTAGSEQFRSIVSAYYRGADAVVLVFDLTNPITFE
jgi:small GTP-binding protein